MQEAVCGAVPNLDEVYYFALKDLLTSNDHRCMRLIKHDHFMLTPDVVALQSWNTLGIMCQVLFLAGQYIWNGSVGASSLRKKGWEK